MAASSGDSLNPCERAGIAAEQSGGLPSGLLLAIGRVESGRWDSPRGRMISWPWTINAAGRGQWFETMAAAAQTVRTLLEGGTRSIDVGCFQISLLYHPAAFASLEQAFDPDANARYAARFLVSLFGQTGSWEAAVAAYHSADPVLGTAYRQQVYATWLGAAPVTAVYRPPIRTGTTPMPGAVPRANPVALPVVIAGVQIWTPMPIGTAATVVAMPGPPTPDASRVLAASNSEPLPAVSYRVMPIGVMPHR